MRDSVWAAEGAKTLTTAAAWEDADHVDCVACSPQIQPGLCGGSTALNRYWTQLNPSSTAPFDK
jgi:hypothetical protein